MEKLNPLCAASGSQHGADTMEDGMDVLQKIKNRVTV